MQLIPITSTAIEAAAYDPTSRILRLKFREGSTYDYPNTTAEEYARFLASDSKGRYVRQHFAGRGERVAPEPEPLPDAPRPLHFHDEDECCGPALSKMLATGKLDKSDSWTHRKCGCEWRAAMRPDGSVYWQPVTVIAFI